MGITFVALIALHYGLDYSMESMESILFVQAGDDDTFEKDEIYTNYIQSAKLQQSLM